MELIFEVREVEEGGNVARALGHAIFTEAETWEELRGNVLEVASLHFEDEAERPKLIQLHFVKDELLDFLAAAQCKNCIEKGLKFRAGSGGDSQVLFL
jgi:hypothetical protein